MNYLITGGSGFVGQNFIKTLKEDDKIFVLSRNSKKNLGQNVKTIHFLNFFKNHNQIDVIINLAGEPIANKRWSKKQKEILIESRIKTTQKIIGLISRLKQKPKILISASAIGFYGSFGNEKLDENSRPKQEFTHFLCKQWEIEAKKAEKYGVNTCITRFGIILGKDGGALKKMLPAFKFGLGGKIASGEQFMSFVHIEDAVLALKFLINKNLTGTFNITTPAAVKNTEFTKILGAKLNRPTFFNMPLFMIKILFGEMGQTLLAQGQNVYPKNLLQAGFKFKYGNLEQALDNILR